MTTVADNLSSTLTDGDRESFSPQHFTMIPNPLLNLVVNKKLKERDVLAYALLLARSGAMKATRDQDYSAWPEATMAKHLGCSVRTLRTSIRRLLNAGLIERQDTRCYTRTRVLMTVEDSRVVTRETAFPPRKAKPDLGPGVFANGEAEFDDLFDVAVL
jgi:hypothetical protein